MTLFMILFMFAVAILIFLFLAAIQFSIIVLLYPFSNTVKNFVHDIFVDGPNLEEEEFKKQLFSLENLVVFIPPFCFFSMGYLILSMIGNSFLKIMNIFFNKILDISNVFSIYKHHKDINKIKKEIDETYLC